jgi:hypothetical protein
MIKLSIYSILLGSNVLTTTPDKEIIRKRITAEMNFILDLFNMDIKSNIKTNENIDARENNHNSKMKSKHIIKIMIIFMIKVFIILCVPIKYIPCRPMIIEISVDLIPPIICGFRKYNLPCPIKVNRPV